MFAMIRFISFCAFAFLVFCSYGFVSDLPSGRSVPLNEGWQFHFAYDVRVKPEIQTVNLPHTWNADEVKDGRIDYTRTTGIYEKKLRRTDEWKDKRLFLRFEGANSVATLFVNGKFVGEHRGGYTAFSFEISSFIVPEKENVITVYVSNAFRLDVLPLSGDFNIYGGIHRPVSLLVTEQNCISPLEHASSGVFITPTNISRKDAQVNVQTKLSLKGKRENLKVRTSIFDAAGSMVAHHIAPVESADVMQNLRIGSPVLWQGKENPYLYRAKVELLQNNKPVDSLTESFGVRYFQVDSDKGFFLNGKRLDLHGVGRHEDFEGKGSALTAKEDSLDMALIEELGATSIRLTHYPHKKSFYDLADRRGLVLWTEIPLVGPGGYTGPGYVNHPNLQDHARMVLTEMIQQNYNHPSVFFWGLFNELKFDYDDPVAFVEELNRLAKGLDSTRLTVCASFLDNDAFHAASDLIAWNKYYGWYGGKPEQIGTWADATHEKFPRKPIAVSEYGAGAAVGQHSDSLYAPVTTGKFHPEQWQTYYHEKNWEALSVRPFLWAKYIWVFADFGSSIRNEGDTSGMNDKGLLTYDRKIKKDAFYFYKANWNPEPMLYLSEKRFYSRSKPVTDIKVFTNLKQAELFVNGKSYGVQQKDELNRIVWKEIPLVQGKNRVEVKGKIKKNTLSDHCEWFLR